MKKELTPLTTDQWLEVAATDIRHGGFSCSRDEAMELAESRLRVGGLLPCEYPRIGGGCFVASAHDGMIELREIPLQKPNDL